MFDFREKRAGLIRRAIESKYFYLFFYAFLSLIIMGPLLLPAPVLTLDMRFGPNVQIVPPFYGLFVNAESMMRLAFTSLMAALNSVMPFWLWQKVLFFLVFFLSGVSAHRLVGGKSPGAYFAGLLYTLNPFTYVRFLAGQFVVLAVYALFPFAVKGFLNLMGSPNLKKAVKVALLTTLVGLMYEHGFFLLFVVYLVILAVRCITLKRPSAVIKTVKHTIYAALVFIPLNIYWLLPFLAVAGNATEQIGYLDLTGFAAAPTSTIGVMFDVASMYGFWRGGYTYTKDILPGWWLLFAFILFLAIYGYLSFSRDEKTGWIARSFAAIGVTGFVLAVGAGSQYTRPLFEWLWKNVPYFNIFRDSQKFVGLLCLSYAFLGALAVDRLSAEFRRAPLKNTRIFIAATLVISMLTPPIYSFTMFGFNGQLATADYPVEWYRVNDYLNRDTSDFNVLFLPFHEFMDFSWLPNRDKRLGNPAGAFFTKPVIQGDNIEMPGIYTQSTNPVSGYVSFLLGKSEKIDNFGELLAPLNVKYVILVAEADYQKYDFLYRQAELKNELSLPGITLFENVHPTARIYGVNSGVYIKNLDEYLELSKTQEVMEHLYVFGDGAGDTGSGMIPVEFTRASELRYTVKGNAARYTIFTVPQRYSTNGWTYNGEKEIKNLGFMPAFLSGERGGDIVYERFYTIFLPGYLISLATLIAIAGYFIFIHKKPSGKSRIDNHPSLPL